MKPAMNARGCAADVVFKLNASHVIDPGVTLPPGAAWERTSPDDAPVLRVEAPDDRDPIVVIPLDLLRCRGLELALTCQMKGEQAAAEPWDGILCAVRYQSRRYGPQLFYVRNMVGTFDWRTVLCVVPVHEDAEKGELLLGLSQCRGVARIKDVALCVRRPKPARPAPRTDLPAPDRGHRLPRLRGVMSPFEFKEQDLADLESWNANLIRWQMTRNWFGINTDRDPADYDRWLTGKLDEMEQVLDSATRHGLLVLPDLHTPPGGRLAADGTMNMFLERDYGELFIRSWRKIATRLKGHPALWAYDLINEPMQNVPSPPGVPDWRELQILAARAIREVDRSVPLVMESPQGANAQAFFGMEPVDLARIIYSPHCYTPEWYTHQFVFKPWSGRPEDLHPYPGKLPDGSTLDKAYLRRALQPVREFQLSYNVPILVGEFSAIRWAPGADAYIADCLALFEEYGWDWCFHSYREWPGFSAEHAEMPVDTKVHPLAVGTTSRAKALNRWYRQNVRPGKIGAGDRR